MKTNKLLALLLVLPLMVSCGETPSETPSESIPSHQDSNKPTEPQTPSINVDNGTDAAKLLLANERLDSSVLEGSNNIFTKGKKAFSKIVNETRRYTVKYAGRPNETYTEIDGDTIKWYNDVDYSNFNSFFESYATNIENSALRGGQLIDDTKKYIRVIDKWVNVGGQEYLLKVNEVSETIYSRMNNYVEMCKRYTNEAGLDVYEMYTQSNLDTVRMKYIPGLVYEFTISNGEFTHYLFAENYKGYWTVSSLTNIESYEFEGNLIETASILTMILKDEACYQFATTVFNDRPAEINSVKIISADHKTDLIDITPHSFTLYNTGIKGLDYIKIEASEERRGEFKNNPELDRNTYVYVQNSIDDNGNPYTIYTTSGYKSATAVLENGMEFTEGDTFIDDQIRVGRIDVGYVAGCDSYGSIPFYTTSTNLDENFELIKAFLNETNITFRRELETVLNSAEFALNDAPNFAKYYKWNGYSVNDIAQIKLAMNAEQQKTKNLQAAYDLIKDSEVIDYENQKAMNENMYFADLELVKDMVISNEGFTITLSESEVKVSDTLLFVDKEYYKLVLGLLNEDGSIIPLYNERETATQFVKGNEFTTSQQLTVEIPILNEGKYVLVVYVATKDEGIRVTNPMLVSGTFTEASNIATKYSETISTNDEGNLLLTIEETNDIYTNIIGSFTYEGLEQVLAEVAYQYGTLPEELVIEELKEGTWVVLEKPVIEESNDNEEQVEGETQETNDEQSSNEESSVVDPVTYTNGQYRLKYEIITTIDAEQIVEYGYVYLTLEEPEIE